MSRWYFTAYFVCYQVWTYRKVQRSGRQTRNEINAIAYRKTRFKRIVSVRTRNGNYLCLLYYRNFFYLEWIPSVPACKKWFSHGDTIYHSRRPFYTHNNTFYRAAIIISRTHGRTWSKSVDFFSFLIPFRMSIRLFGYVYAFVCSVHADCLRVLVFSPRIAHRNGYEPRRIFKEYVNGGYR